MLQAAKLQSGWGKLCGGEAILSDRQELRDTAIHSLRWERTRIRESLELLLSWRLGNSIDQLKAAFPPRFRARARAKRPVQAIVPRGATSQGMRREPWSPRGSNSSRMRACCRHPGSPDESVDPASVARPLRRGQGRAFHLAHRESGSCDIASPEKPGRLAARARNGCAKTRAEWEHRSRRP